MLNLPKENCIERRHNGAAYLIKVGGQPLIVIASNGRGWDHVSVSHRKRCPTWHEMCRVKDMFFSEEDIVLQFHPPKSDYVNVHPRCLHLWRNQTSEIELPPIELV